MNKLYFACSFLALLAFYQPTFAYKPEVEHACLTNVAVEMLIKCAKLEEEQNHTIFKQYESDFTDNKEALITANKNEDESNLDRLRDWHFFNPAVSEHQTAVILGQEVYLSLVRLYRQILANTQVATDKSAFYLEIGRVLHYIEDMTVPAHVVPVFHPYVSTTDCNSSICSDPFDEFPIQHGGLCDAEEEKKLNSSLNSLKSVYDNLSLATCRAIVESVPTSCLPTNYLWELLEQTSNDTRSRLTDDPICGGTDTWGKKFWLRPDQVGESIITIIPGLSFPTSFFGAYTIHKFGSYRGIGGDGKNVIARCENGKNQPITRDMYNEFAFIQQRNAIFADMKVLLCGARFFESRP